MNTEQRDIAVELLIEKSNRNMEQAIRNAELDYWDLVANRLYYSVFHAVTALMLTDGITTYTHKGTSSQFGRRIEQTQQLQQRIIAAINRVGGKSNGSS